MITISEKRARVIGESIGIDFTKINLGEFRSGIIVELEHGLKDPETNVTNNDLGLTCKIAWAHLKELPDYYSRLSNIENETY